jgi:hypothetical protein
MQGVNKLHQEAMEIADQAAEALRRGDSAAYLRLTAEALKREAEAARKVAGDLEPTRSVLFRSAATLAVECQEFRVAEQLIGAALAGSPPPEIAEELRDLLEDVYFHRHLELRGVTLAPGEVQMTLEGAAVGFGMTRSEPFVQRLSALETLLYRTAERLRRRPFREAGRRTKQLTEVFELYLSVPRAASFAVTLKLGTQMELPGVNFPAQAMKEVLDGLDLVNSGNLVALEERIPDQSYRLNFIGLVERLAPDGEDIRTVGFTAGADQASRVVALATPRKKLMEHIRKAPSPGSAKKPGKRIQIQGVLLEADATRQKEGVIEVVDATGAQHRIFVPRGMMSDIVKPMFEEEVTVSCTQKGKHIHLESIDLAEAGENPK